MLLAAGEPPAPSPVKPGPILSGKGLGVWSCRFQIFGFSTVWGHFWESYDKDYNMLGSILGPLTSGNSHI